MKNQDLELRICPVCREKQYGWSVISDSRRVKLAMLCRVCGYIGIQEEDKYIFEEE